MKNLIIVGGGNSLRDKLYYLVDSSKEKWMINANIALFPFLGNITKLGMCDKYAFSRFQYYIEKAGDIEIVTQNKNVSAVFGYNEPKKKWKGKLRLVDTEVGNTGIMLILLALQLEYDRIELIGFDSLWNDGRELYNRENVYSLVETQKEEFEKWKIITRKEIVIMK